MAISDSQKVDLLYKKLFGVAKSDTSTNKSPSNEATASPFINRGDKVWVQASSIPATAAATAGIVQAYLTTAAIQTTADNTTTPVGGVYPTWKTGLTDWIPPEFGATYFVSAYAGTSGLSDPTVSATKIFDSGSGGTGEWFFDYQAGVLNFIGTTIPTALTSSNVVYITGYRYIGQIGVSTIAANTIYTQGVDTTQNSRITIIEATDVSQNSRMTIIEGVDTTQNSRMTIIEGVDVSQNSRMTIIEGVDLTQNTNINNKLSLTGALNQTVSGNVTISQDLVISGNLIVSGNVTSQNTQQLSVADPLIVLGIGNYVSDTKDIGFAGHYNDGTNAHSGLIRDSGTKDWYLFKGYTPELDANNNVVITDPSFSTANLNANYVKSNLIATTATVNGWDVASVWSSQNTNITSVNTYAGSGYALANTHTGQITVIQGVDTNQNTQISGIQGVDTSQNSRMTIIEGVDATQNTNITAVNTYAGSGYALGNTNSSAITVIQGVDTNQNTQISGIQGVDAAQNTRMTIIEGVDTSQNSRMTIIEGVDTSQNTRMTIIEGVDSGQNTRMAIIEGVDSGQNTTITAVNTYAGSAYALGNTNSGAITVIQGVDTNQNTQISGIQGVDTSQNTRMTIIEGVDTGQNTTITAVNTYAGSGYALANTHTGQISVIQGVDTNQNTQISGIQGVDTAQNTRMTIIEGVDTGQNTTITAVNTYAGSAYAAGNTNATNITAVNTYAGSGYALANTHTGQITVIQGVDTSQNSRMTIIEGVDSGQNTYIQAAFDKANTSTASQPAFDKANSANVLAQSAFDKANSANILAQAAFSKANTSIQTSGGSIVGNLNITGNLIVNGSNTFLGNVANVHITGGNTGQILTTDNAGNLSFIDLPTTNTTTYTASTLTLTNGVYVSGSVTDTQVLNDGNYYQLTDGSGLAPAWIVTFGFTGVTKFNRIVSNIDYTLASGHIIYFQLYNYNTSFTLASATVSTTTGTNIVTVSSTTGMSVGQTIKFGTSVGGLTSGTPYYILSIPSPGQLTVGTGTSSGSIVTLSTASVTSTVSIEVWDNFGSYTGASGFEQSAKEVLSYSAYINSGAVTARLYHSNQGNTGHISKIDYFALEQSAQGAQGPRGATGTTGTTGATGNGVSSGGNTGQLLIKTSDVDYATAWSNTINLVTLNVSSTLTSQGVDIVGALSSNATYQSGINSTQNTNITTANNAAWAAYAAGNTNATNITAVNTYAGSAYALGNTNSGAITIIQGVDTTQNSRMTIIEGTDTSQNSRMTIIEGVDVTQNTNITSVNTYAGSGYALANTHTGQISVIQGVDTNQNTQISGIQGVDTAQNTRMTIIEGVDVTQNTNITAVNTYAGSGYALGNTNSGSITVIQGVDTNQNTQISGIQGVDTAQNTRMTIIEGVDATQNTNISNKVNLTGSLNQTISGNITISQDLSVTGNLIVLGNTVTINTSSFAVVDPMILLGLGNYTTDLLDIGFAGHYNDGTNAHTGFIRDSVTKDWYVFKGYTPELNANNNIDINDASFRKANINADYAKTNLIATTATINGLDVSSVWSTQNTRMTVIEGVDTNQNTQISGIQGVDTAQNTRMTIIEGVDSGQNTTITAVNTYAGSAYAAGNTNATNITAVNTYAGSGYALGNTNSGAITVIQGVDTTQNSRMTIIEGVDTGQNTTITAVNTYAGSGYALGNTNSGAITVIQGVDTAQNTRMTVIEGVDSGQNTFMQSSFDKANNAVANIGPIITTNTSARVFVSNTTSSTSNTTGALTVAGGVGLSGNFYSTGGSALYISANTYGDGGTGTGANALVYINQINGWSSNSPWSLYVTGYSNLGGLRINAVDSSRSLHKIGAGSLGFSTSDATGSITFGPQNGTTVLQVSPPWNTANTTNNYIQIRGGDTQPANANGVFLTVQGVDANADLFIVSKGTTSNVRINGVNVVDALSSNATYQSGINSSQNTYAQSVNTYAYSAYAQANVTAGGLVTANSNTVYLQGALNTANANITYILGAQISQNSYAQSVNTYAWSAYAQANTDFTTLTATSGTFGSSTLIPVVTLAANGRVTGITTTAVSGSGGSSNSFSTILVAGQPNLIANTSVSPLTLVAGSGITITTVGTSNTITIASTGGFSGGTIANTLTLSNTTSSYSNSNNALQVAGGVGVANSIYVGNRVGFGNTSNSFAYTIYNSTYNSIDTIFG